MDKTAFWKIIDRSRNAAGGDPDEQLDHLEAMLKELDPDEVVEFDRIFSEYHSAAYTWPLWGAAYLIEGGCSDDGFMDFRGWLISRGQKVYEEALASPDSLADVIGDDEGTQIEDFQYLPRQVWAELTGKDETDFPEISVESRDEPLGARWEEDELDKLFPKLAKRFG